MSEQEWAEWWRLTVLACRQVGSDFDVLASQIDRYGITQDKLEVVAWLATFGMILAGKLVTLPLSPGLN